VAAGFKFWDAYKVVSAAGSLQTEEALPPGDAPADIARDRGADEFLPPQSSEALLAAAILTCILPIPFIFTNGPLWAAQHLLPPMRAAGWIALAINAAALAFCGVSKPLRTPIAFSPIDSPTCTAGSRWLSGLVLTYLLWGVEP